MKDSCSVETPTKDKRSSLNHHRGLYQLPRVPPQTCEGMSLDIYGIGPAVRGHASHSRGVATSQQSGGGICVYFPLRVPLSSPSSSRTRFKVCASIHYLRVSKWADITEENQGKSYTALASRARGDVRRRQDSVGSSAGNSCDSMPDSWSSVRV